MEKINSSETISGSGSRPNEPMYLKVSTSGNQHQPVPRGCSPNFDIKLRTKRWEDDIFRSDDSTGDLIHDVATLSNAVGLVKSFSTTDITLIPRESLLLEPSGITRKPFIRNAVSEIEISSEQRSNYLFQKSKLENLSRSCSTWVTVGDISSTSQLPSPHGGRSNVISSSSCTTATENTLKYGQPNFTAADFICCVNKRVRQQYIKKRLMTIYRALQCLSQSEFNLDRLPIRKYVIDGKNAEKKSEDCSSPAPDRTNKMVLCPTITIENKPAPGAGVMPDKSRRGSSNFFVAQKKLVTVRDVERDKGQPLSKYDRNMMIFNWLLTLNFEEEDTTTEETRCNNLAV